MDTSVAGTYRLPSIPLEFAHNRAVRLRTSQVQLSVDEASVIEFAPVAGLSVNTHTSSSLFTMGHSKRESLVATESDSTVHAQ